MTMLARTKPGQAHVLDLLKLIRPWTMRDNQKVRVGNAYDGGYVLPAAIARCDAVVSIGVGHDVSFDLARRHHPAVRPHGAGPAANA
jgi:hypothetical protein